MSEIFRLGNKGHLELASTIGGFLGPRFSSLHFFYKTLLQNPLTETINNFLYYYNKNLKLKIHSFQKNIRSQPVLLTCLNRLNSRMSFKHSSSRELRLPRYCSLCSYKTGQSHKRCDLRCQNIYDILQVSNAAHRVAISPGVQLTILLVAITRGVMTQFHAIFFTKDDLRTAHLWVVLFSLTP